MIYEGKEELDSLNEIFSDCRCRKTIPFVCVSGDPAGHCEGIGIYVFDVPVTEDEWNIIRDSLELCLPLKGNRRLKSLYSRARKLIEWRRVREWYDWYRRNGEWVEPYSVVRKFVSVQLGEDPAWAGCHAHRIEPAVVLRQFRELLAKEHYEDIVRAIVVAGRWFAEDNPGMNIADMLLQAHQLNFEDECRKMLPYDD